MDYDYLKASDGTGDAALMHVDAVRLVGSSTLVVDTLDNVPAKFIGTSGTLASNGFLDPNLPITNFLGHTNAGNIIIDDFEPGSTDVGNTETEVVIIKPTTGWSNRVADYIGRTSVVLVASSATLTPDVDVTGKYFITALAANATFGAPAGTPNDGQTLLIRIKDNATARTLAWNAIYRAIGVTLPATTVISKTLYIGFVYNATAVKWDAVMSVIEA